MFFFNFYRKLKFSKFFYQKENFNKIIFDGYPRNHNQIKSLDSLLEKYNQEQQIKLDQIVKVEIFDKKQNHVAVINSAKAEVDQKTNNMKAIGDVVAVSDSGITLYTDTLFWNAKKEQMNTKDSVMITTIEKDTLYGVGFESDSDLQNWKVLKPSGVTNRVKK